MIYPLVKRVTRPIFGELLRMMLSERLFFDLTWRKVVPCHATSRPWRMTFDVTTTSI